MKNKQGTCFRPTFDMSSFSKEGSIYGKRASSLHQGNALCRNATHTVLLDFSVVFETMTFWTISEGIEAKALLCCDFPSWNDHPIQGSFVCVGGGGARRIPAWRPLQNSDFLKYLHESNETGYLLAWLWYHQHINDIHLSISHLI